MEDSIRQFGCGEPIYVWSKRLLVDYDRYAIFHRLHIPFRIINCSARNSEEVIDWICRDQLRRTNLTDPLRRYLIRRQYLALELLGAHYAASASPAKAPEYHHSMCPKRLENFQRGRSVAAHGNVRWDPWDMQRSCWPSTTKRPAILCDGHSVPAL